MALTIKWQNPWRGLAQNTPAARLCREKVLPHEVPTYTKTLPDGTQELRRFGFCWRCGMKMDDADSDR